MGGRFSVIQFPETYSGFSLAACCCLSRSAIAAPNLASTTSSSLMGRPSLTSTASRLLSARLVLISMTSATTPARDVWRCRQVAH
jgi:hypothetical protein